MKIIFEKSQAMAPEMGEVASGETVSKFTFRGWLKSQIVAVALLQTNTLGSLPFALAVLFLALMAYSRVGGLSHD